MIPLMNIRNMGRFRRADGNSSLFAPGTVFKYPNGAKYILDYEYKLRYYGWENYPPEWDVKFEPADYNLLIQYSSVNSEGWFGRKITASDPLILEAPAPKIIEEAKLIPGQPIEEPVKSVTYLDEKINTEEVPEKKSVVEEVKEAKDAVKSTVKKNWPVIVLVLALGLMAYLKLKKGKKG